MSNRKQTDTWAERGHQQAPSQTGRERGWGARPEASARIRRLEERSGKRCRRWLPTLPRRPAPQTPRVPRLLLERGIHPPAGRESPNRSGMHAVRWESSQFLQHTSVSFFYLFHICYPRAILLSNPTNTANKENQQWLDTATKGSQKEIRFAL